MERQHGTTVTVKEQRSRFYRNLGRGERLIRTASLKTHEPYTRSREALSSEVGSYQRHRLLGNRCSLVIVINIVARPHDDAVSPENRRGAARLTSEHRLCATHGQIESHRRELAGKVEVAVVGPCVQNE